MKGHQYFTGYELISECNFNKALLFENGSAPNESNKK